MTVHSWGQRVKMARVANRCVALVGTVGVDARCSIYDNRPQVCRDYDPATRTAECNDCRAPHGLPPIQHNAERTGGKSGGMNGSPSSESLTNTEMNITDLIEDLELDAAMSADNGNAEDGKLCMRAAGVLRRIHRILTPFADAAEAADKASEEQNRLLGSELTPDASPGWGIKRRHLDAAREFLRENPPTEARP